MKSALIACCILLAVLATVSVASPAKGSTKAALKKKPCLKECSEEEYKPVCAGDGSGKDNKSFGSECVLSNFNCENGKDWKIQSQGECPGGGGVRLS